VLRYWIWLSTRKYLNDRDKLRVLTHFATPDLVYLADSYAYSQIEGLSDKKIKCLLDKDLTEAENILCDCDNKRISILTWQDAGYPQRLRHIEDPPLVLYYAGRFPHVDDEVAIAVVGTRKASAYGLKHAKELGYQLGRGGAIVVSGCAEGIDTAGMEGALTAGKPVIGVLGCGVDRVYPKFNKRLYEDIRHNGCLVSEFPPGTPPYGNNFLIRNRIISGLSLGVLVVEAPARSGSLNTARHALEQGRDVFAIPCSLDMKHMQGNLNLLKDGAILVEHGADVLKEYATQYLSVSDQRVTCQLDVSEIEQYLEAKAASPGAAVPSVGEKITVDRAKNTNYIDLVSILPTVDDDEAKVLKALADGQRHIDDVIESTGLSASKILGAVTMLEIRGYITRLPGQRFSLSATE